MYSLDISTEAITVTTVLFILDLIYIVTIDTDLNLTAFI